MRQPVNPRTYTSQWDFDYHQVVNAGLLGQYFHSLLMAALIRADTVNRQLLALAFPAVAADLFERGHDEMPVQQERAERGDQARPGAMTTPGADVFDPFAVVEQLQEAMGNTHYSWAAPAIAILQARHPAFWDDAVSSAQNQNLRGDLT